MTQREAKANGLKRYFGKVCDKHPKLKGERYISGHCPECACASEKTPKALARRRAYRKTPEARARKAARQKTPEYLARHRVYLRARRKRLRARQTTP
jgi:methionyl-tRNA synthetase